MTDTGPAPAPAPAPAAPAPSTGGASRPSAFRSSMKSPAPAPQKAPSLPEPTVDSSGFEVEAAPQPIAVEDTSVQEVAEDDYSWLDGLKPHKQLHGVELTELVEALSQGILPPEVAKHVRMQFKNGEDTWEGTLEEARREHMMHRDYTQKTQRFQEERAGWNKEKDDFLGMLQNWKSKPDALLAGLEHLEFPILEAAKLLAYRHRELDAMSPDERRLYDEKQKFEKERYKFNQEQQNIARTKKEHENRVAQKHYEDTVTGTAQRLYQESGVPYNDATWKLFLRNFEVYTNAGSPWDAQTVQLAFEAMSHDYRDVLAKRQSAQSEASSPQPKQSFSSPAKEQVARAGIVQRVQGQAAKGKGGATRPSDFMKGLRGETGRR